MAEYVDQKMRAQGPGTFVEGAGSAKRMTVKIFPPQRSQGRTFSNPLVLP